jgi:hypothetical protein
MNDELDMLSWEIALERERIAELRCESQQIYHLYLDGEIDGWDAINLDKRINRALEEYAIRRQTISF